MFDMISSESAHGDRWVARLRREFLARVSRTGHARPESAAECEKVMRRMGMHCANPAEHRRA